MEIGCSLASELRPATDADADWMFALHELVFRPHIDALWGWDEAWQRANFEYERAECSSSIVVSDQVAVGYIQIGQTARSLTLFNIALYPEHQRRGIGTAVLRSLQRRAAALGVPVVLRVFRTNQRALALYRRLGFAQVAHIDAQYELAWRAVDGA